MAAYAIRSHVPPGRPRRWAVLRFPDPGTIRASLHPHPLFLTSEAATHAEAVAVMQADMDRRRDLVTVSQILPRRPRAARLHGAVSIDAAHRQHLERLAS